MAGTDILEQYREDFRELVRGQEHEEVPDRVKKYTKDVYGRDLPCEFVQLNERLVYHLNKIPEYVSDKGKYDYLGLCFGYPGVGKTHTLQRICLYLNAGFSLDDIHFTAKQLEEWIDKAPPASVCIFDEADVMASNYYDKVLRAIIQQSKRIRTKRLVIFMATPTMKDMNSYFAFRARMVIYSFVPPKGEITNRGWIHAWHSKDLIADLYARMKKAYSETSIVYNKSYSTLKNCYIGRESPPDWPICEEAYEDKKEAARQELFEQEGWNQENKVVAFRRQTAVNLYHLRDELLHKHGVKIAIARLADILDINRKTFSEYLTKGGVR
jgi:hypothetical protein